MEASENFVGRAAKDVRIVESPLELEEHRVERNRHQNEEDSGGDVHCGCGPRVRK